MLFPSALLSALALFAAAQSVAALPAKPFPMARMESGELGIPAERDFPSAPMNQVYGRSSAKFRGGKKRLISDSIPTFSDNGDVQVFKGGAGGKRTVAPISDSIPTSSDNGVLKVFTGGKNSRRGLGEDDEMERRTVAPISDSIPTSSDNGVLKVFTGGKNSRRSVEKEMEERDVAPINDNVPTSSENGVLKVFKGPGVARALENDEHTIVERFFQEEFAPVEKKMSENGKTKRAVVFGRAGKASRSGSTIPKRRLPKESDDLF